jgi:MFS family permease
MGGVLITSIVSGQLLSRFGRYRPFPILGTALMSIAMGLIATVAVSTPVWQSALYTVVLGLGLGMTMQVLVVAAQNAVPFSLIGVATSGSTLFRQVGGSVGVAVFGTIFANRLATALSDRLPSGSSLPDARSPGAIHALPPDIRNVYLESFTDALRDVFLVAAVVSALAFILAWFLREVPLREDAAFANKAASAD